jgi:hypothetical protein
VSADESSRMMGDVDGFMPGWRCADALAGLAQTWHGLVDTLRLLPTVNVGLSVATTDEERVKEMKVAQKEKK